MVNPTQRPIERMFMISLFIILGYNAIISSGPLYVVNDLIRYLALFLAVVGVIVIRQAFRAYSLSEFLGLQKELNRKLVREGILRYIRHPLYTGTILIVLGLFMYSPTYATLTTLLCVIIYLIVGISLEEKKLINIYGDEYRIYKRDVPALIPRFW